MCLKAYENRNEMPTEWEQDVAKAYVNERRLVRPNTNIKTALCSVLLFVLATGLFTWIAHFVFMSAGISWFSSSGARDFYNAHFFSSTAMLCAVVVFVEFVFCFKHATIGMVKLYQHYASEEVRRRCLFMPTCSEYAIMAVRKYGCIVGLWKSYYRLMYRCRGNIYMIDYP